MKKTRRSIISIMLVAVLVIAMAIPAFAVTTGTITITPPSGVKATDTNTYKIYIKLVFIIAHFSVILNRKLRE